MFDKAKDIMPNSTWIVDSKFKTNQQNMPLNTRMCLNAMELEIPIFLMIYSTTKNSN